MNYINFDIETYSPSKSDKFDVEEFRCSVCGAYFSWIDEYVAFYEENMPDFIELLSKADLIVGYNQIGFDLPVLQKYADFNLLSLPNYDILQEIYNQTGTRIKLNDVCKANFGDDIKTDNFEVFKHYYWDEKWYELTDYCMNDVRLTQRIFQKIIQQTPVYYYDLHQKVEVSLKKPEKGKVNTAIPETSDSLF